MDHIHKTLEKRRRKREQKAKIVHVPTDNTKFIDENLLDPTESTKEGIKPKKKKKKLDTSEIQGFTVLGTDSFNKKTKVITWLFNCILGMT